MYYDDFYDYPPEYEQKISELKETILKSVKQEYQEEMERLRKENEELQEFKKERVYILLSHKAEVEKLEKEKINAKKEAKKARLSELLGDELMVGWCSKDKIITATKCDLCDENRQIEFTMPSGKKSKESCYICGEKKRFFESKCVKLYKVYQSKHGYVHRYYELINNENEDDLFESCRIPYNGEEFKDVTLYDAVFFNQEDCQKYCDWLNEKKE